MRIMFNVKMSFQFGRLKTLTGQQFIANQTKWTVFRHGCETILQITFVVRSLFAMTCLVFLMELLLF